MKKLFLLSLFLFLSISGFAQQSTEVYLFDMEFITQYSEENTKPVLTNPVNVSSNTGYDNQPSFTKDGKTLLFASTRNNQTDILWYDIQSGSKRWISNTEGGEYSPVLMPDGKHISAVRLDPDGFQRLYKYSIESGESEILVEELVIGYYAWFLQSKIMAFVLGNPATLHEIDMTNNKSENMYTNPGRSIHYIPASKQYSFIDKSDSTNWKIMRAVPGNSEWTKEITSTLPGVEDMVWLNMHTILMGKDDKLYSYNTRSDSGEWKLFADLSEYGLSGITRLAVSSNKLALVVTGK